MSLATVKRCSPPISAVKRSSHILNVRVQYLTVDAEAFFWLHFIVKVFYSLHLNWYFKKKKQKTFLFITDIFRPRRAPPGQGPTHTVVLRSTALRLWFPWERDRCEGVSRLGPRPGPEAKTSCAVHPPFKALTSQKRQRGQTPGLLTRS